MRQMPSRALSDQGSNPWPPDHDSTFNVPETSILTIRPLIRDFAMWQVVPVEAERNMVKSEWKNQSMCDCCTGEACIKVSFFAHSRLESESPGCQVGFLSVLLIK